MQACRIALAVAVGGLTASAAGAADKPPLCDFLEKVRAGSANEFAALRGEGERDIFLNKYPGTLVPEPNVTCSIHRDGQKDSYDCAGTWASMAELKSTFERYASALPVCYPKMAFKRGANGSEATHNEQRFISGGDRHVHLEVTATDFSKLGSGYIFGLLIELPMSK